MKFFRAIAILTLAPGICLGINVDLPEWNAPKEAAAYSLGGGLWPSGLIPNADEKSKEETPADGEKNENAKLVEGVPVTGEVGREKDGAAENGGEVAADATKKEELPTEPPVPEEEIVEELPPIEGRLREQYFSLAPVDFLLDPQGLLTEQKSNDLRRFLEFHSDESNFHIFVMVMGDTQKVPADISLEKLHGSWFGENPSVLMVYHRERPELTQLVYNTSVTAAFEKTVFDRIMQNCLREGAATENAPDQVEKMAVELSIQLYWLTRLLERQISDRNSAVEGTAVAEAGKSVSGAPNVLREDAPGLFPEGDSIKWMQMAAKSVVLLAIVLIAGLIGWAVMWFWRRDSAGGKPLLFPDCETVPRLGGEFSGGGFVGMSFEIGDSDGRFD